MKIKLYYCKCCYSTNEIVDLSDAIIISVLNIINRIDITI